MISTNPYKGTKDFYPNDQLVQNYIFDKWKEVALSHGFQEYQTPIIEPSEIYEAKSGEDVGNKELFTFTDLGDRKLCLRPEMTPSVTRIVAGKYKELPKPIKYFSIGSFYRNERPQKGRNREFWQINADIFGDSTIYSDLETITLALDIMKSFGAPKNSFKIYINHRALIDGFLNELDVQSESKVQIIRIIDKFEKLSPALFKIELEKIVDSSQAEKIEKFLSLNSNELENIFPNLKNNSGFKDLAELVKLLKSLNLDSNISFKPSLVRGFDYYDGLVFEVFDNNPDNIRSLFGGGRYNGLANIFGQNNFPAIGFAVGNETFRIFLENWNLIPSSKEILDKVQVGIFAIKNHENLEENKILLEQVFITSNEIRTLIPNIYLDTIIEPKSTSAGLDYISNKNYDYALILGSDEIKDKKITLKDMQLGKQQSLTLHQLIEYLNTLPNEKSK
jgi:histidyl-tRNA synthetase